MRTGDQQAVVRRWHYAAVVAGLTLVVAAAPMTFANRPRRAKCGAAVEREALRRAQRVFPRAKIRRASYGCSYWGSKRGGVMHTIFAKYRLRERVSRITFVVHDGLGILFRKRRPRFMLVPFDSRRALKRTARQIRQHPVIRRAFGRRALTCAAGSDAPGAAGYFVCAPRPLKRSPSSLKMSRHGPAVKFSQRLGHPAYGGSRGSPKVVGYAIPVNQLAPQAKRWPEARRNSKVAAFVRRHPRAMVVLERWHQDYMSLIPRHKPKDKLVVVWGRRRGRRSRGGAGPGIQRVCRTPKPLDCIHKVMYRHRRKR